MSAYPMFFYPTIKTSKRFESLFPTLFSNDASNLLRKMKGLFYMNDLMEEYLAQGNSLSNNSEYDCHADYSDYMDRYDADQHNDFDVDGGGLPD